MKSTIVACVAFAGLASAASAQIFPEVEDNGSKAAANAFVMQDGSVLRGIAAGSDLDYFRVTNTARPLAIYRHRLILTSDIAGHTATLRGLSQSDGGAGVGGVINQNTDIAFQSSVILPGGTSRMNQWYGFGKGESLFYRVAGTADTTAMYNATLVTDTVEVTNLGNYQPGHITLSSVNMGHNTDTDLWVYDGNLNAIAGYGNDDTTDPNTSVQSFLNRVYAPGTYYIAISDYNTANNLASPGDDDFRTGDVLDFPDIIANSSSAAGVNLGFQIYNDSLPFKDGAFDVWWGRFTVVPAPGSLALLGLGGLLAARRRR
ncbi:MAG: PEP-CTERM sorting domain-containing protein [Phycisphaerales bacterium]|nr:PEP-CTERM sorting domain-containing protein [Phycisphaerales bacterium]